MQLGICEMKRSMDQVFMRFEADYGVVLECLQEVYGLEAEHLRLGRDFRRTMVYPFMKMLEQHCCGIPMENLHKVLWEIYWESMREKDFCEKAKIFLKPYYREVHPAKQKTGV